MKKLTRLSEQWFYDLLDRGECDIVDFKERLEDRQMFGKSFKNFAPNYEELARDVVAFANAKGGFLFVVSLTVPRRSMLNSHMISRRYSH